ncbi:MAG: 50S ribosomal protein L23 [Alphaproteobacteria bacterium RIFCSPLOWO2_01_FULL_45_8]|nr:MAG: 50S ribosomal protein L23 [Alphaproteobacteria bacterium GWB1_45_5]OFW76046.1 MAG: 50S ribosomal protein L23 [Alphaproteobacteria bacterium GWA1_45_9]OFW90087.1 MAG: 50S ribosomal protein L23 [Alphaproteobacteria bacterium RIFCSPHIGHO2_01_FULL_41_14]OFW95711.1 MAG: 50S ribosomal protein L23 [Alphaproteobacteria bacterium RIFCSPLOWO2_01_FULL_45_8]HCI48536.1 50S ribosomal protein L23 [Holosporales bacterium]
MKKIEPNKISVGLAYDIIRTPLITEKATFLTQNNQYSFKVATDATKKEVKAAVEKIFKVAVVSVNTMNAAGKLKVFKGRRGRRSDYKKAIVRLKAGQTIDISVGI